MAESAGPTAAARRNSERFRADCENFRTAIMGRTEPARPAAFNGTRLSGTRVALDRFVKVALALLLGLHGSIHALGFAKAFSPGSVSALSAPVSKAMGVLWLATAILWVAAAIMVAAGTDRWWMAALPALLLSQFAIAGAWHDARFGSIVNLILVVPIGLAGLMHAPWSFGAEYARGVKTAAGLPSPRAERLTERDIAALPPPVQRYLHYTGAVGLPRIQTYRVRFRGGIRDKSTDPFMPSTTDQFSRVEPASRWFLMRAHRSGLPFEALHVYEGSHATFRVRVAGAVNVVTASGPEMDQSETVTLFNDLCLLAPGTLAAAPVTWQPVDGHTVRARFVNAGHTIGAELTFDDEGALVNFSSDDRYRSADGKTFTRERWTTPVTSYRSFGGRRVVAAADARWTDSQGEFTYAQFEVTDIAYNVTATSSPDPTS
jgi:hypothetical protein